MKPPLVLFKLVDGHQQVVGGLGRIYMLSNDVDLESPAPKIPLAIQVGGHPSRPLVLFVDIYCICTMAILVDLDEHFVQ